MVWQPLGQVFAHLAVNRFLFSGNFFRPYLSAK